MRGGGLGQLQDFPAVPCTGPANVTFRDTASNTPWRAEDSRDGCPQRQYVTPYSGSRSHACMHEPTSDLEGDTKTCVYSHRPALDEIVAYTLDVLALTFHGIITSREQHAPNFSVFLCRVDRYLKPHAVARREKRGG